MNIFLNKMKSLLGNEFDEFFKFYNNENFRGLRVNTLKCSVDKLKTLIDFEIKPTPFCKEGFYILENVKSIGNNPLHHAGAYYVQEPSATSAVTMLDVKEGDKVLDLCAAPGGKSTQIAAALNGKGLLWANEIVKNRSLILLSNIERMGVRNAVVSNCHPDVLCNSFRGYFDKILVDAPCSGEGMFRKNYDAQNQWSQEHVESCGVRQLQILNSAKNALKEKGVLVYSTCTFSPEENEEVIIKFLKENPDFVLEDSGVSFGRPALKYGRRILPMDGGEGHFAARLRKNSETFAVPVVKQQFKKIPNIVNDFYESTFINKPFGDNIEMIGDKAYAVTFELPEVKGLSVLRKGILLGEIKKNRFEPHHSAFMAAKKEDCTQAVDLDIKSIDIVKFLHGEEIKVSAELKGYTAVCVQGITTGFGKVSSGNLKNKYPKGLRML